MSLAFVFPGQGSQSVGMLNSFAEQYPEVKSTFTEASDVLGYDLWQLVKLGPETELNNTVKTQPALLTAGVALWNIWNKENNTSPKLLAGHSLGEYTALVCAKALSLSEAVQLVADRGEYMQTAVPEGIGSMAAILGLENDQVETLCEKSAQGQIVAAANYNSTGQIVIAGHVEAVERAVTAAKQAGAKRSVILPVSVPSHCELMRTAADHLAERLQAVKFSLPDIPIIHNVDACQKNDIESITKVLVEQLCAPVRWVETIQHMSNEEITHIVECGPGKVLSGLIKRINRNIQTLPISEPDLLEKALIEIGN
jgi:[acyl-carrier-protein] S-malonyltransferase